MKNKYVILLDADGTLVETGKTEICKTVIDSLKYAKQKGHILAIATGRGVKTTLNIEGYNIFNYIACLMGSVIYSVEENKIIYEDENKINNQYVPLIEYFINSGKEWTYKDDKEDKSTMDINIYGNRFNAKIVSKETVFEDIKNNKIFQLLACEEIVDNSIKEKFADLDFVFMPGDYYDILKKGNSKAKVVNYFREKFLDYKIVAIGDSNNDIPMLKAADISIAMGNANSNVKSLCKYQTKTLKEDGVSYAIKEILKI